MSYRLGECPLLGFPALSCVASDRPANRHGLPCGFCLFGFWVAPRPLGALLGCSAIEVASICTGATIRTGCKVPLVVVAVLLGFLHLGAVFMIILSKSSVPVLLEDGLLWPRMERRSAAFVGDSSMTCRFGLPSGPLLWLRLVLAAFLLCLAWHVGGLAYLLSHFWQF